MKIGRGVDCGGHGCQSHCCCVWCVVTSSSGMDIRLSRTGVGAAAMRSEERTREDRWCQRRDVFLLLELCAATGGGLVMAAV